MAAVRRRAASCRPSLPSGAGRSGRGAHTASLRRGHAVEDVFLQYAVTRIGVHRMITRTDPMINRPHDLGKKH